MAPEEKSFQEARLGATPLQRLGLTIEGTRLEPVLQEFLDELKRAGIERLQPRFYLSTEWGVNGGTIAIGIPFYLARPELEALHEERVGLVEGADREDILRYLRHEMGHVVNYAYRLFEDEEWVRLFGGFTQPYVDEYRPKPFSTRYVRHLPGWYAQKHPDEDWSETFAVWMTPGQDWKTEYADWPTALEKLGYCDRKMAEFRNLDPLVTSVTPDDPVAELTVSVDEYYQELSAGPKELPQGIDGALRTVFPNEAPAPAAESAPDNGGQSVRTDPPASGLIRRRERELMRAIYRWTGHFPESTRELLRHLARRADELGLTYEEAKEGEEIVALTTLVTALAMNHVYTGRYHP